jgi:membrane-associated phospholipid phosphatase
LEEIKVIKTTKPSKTKIWWFAQFISYLLHPLMLPTLAFGLILFITPIGLLPVPEKYSLKLLLVISMLTLLMPLCLILIFYTTGVFKSLTMEGREERLMPFLLITIFYSGVTYLLGFGNGFDRLPILSIVVGGIALSIALVTLITYFWKISAHSTGMGGVLGVLIAIYLKYAELSLFTPILVSFILLGMLMSARLYLKAHTPVQVWLGSLLGLVINFGVNIVLL